jgi:hypothetical protein
VQIEEVFHKKIYFAHQSVGENILNGIVLLEPKELSSEGGHLNEMGSKYVAEELLNFISNL